MTKTEAVKQYIASGMFKQALRIAKGFRVGVTAAERYAMSMAYECMVHPAFYESIGVDPHAKAKEGIMLLQKLF